MDGLAASALDLPAPLPALPRIDTRAAPAELRRVAEEFEAVFLGQMFEAMFAGVDTDGPFGGGHGERVFRSLLVQEYAKAASARGGVGIADAVVRQLLSQQEAQP